MASLLRFGTVFFLALALSACGSNPFSPTEELDDAREKWDRQGIDSYSFTIREICFCPIELGGPFRVVVRDGRPVSITRVETGEAAAPEGHVPVTIDQLFAITREAMREADEVEVDYDPTYGFPASVRIDRIENAVDDEVYYEATDFQPLR